MNPSTLFGIGATLLLVAPAVLAQEPEGETSSRSTLVNQSFRTWNENHGTNWHHLKDTRTGYVEFLFGGQAAAAFTPSAEADFISLGRLAIESTEALHGVESGTLAEFRSSLLSLSRIGTTDKVTVCFRQEVGGVPVLGGFVNTLFTTEGHLLSVQTTAMPDLLGISTDALVGADRAATIASRHFEETVGLTGTVVDGPTKAIGQLEASLQGREARLVWVVSVHWSAPDLAPEGYTYWIDAVYGSVIHEESDIHHYDVGGTLNTMATPGTLPDQANNPEQSLPMNHARVDGGAAGTVYTDANGNFNFPGVTGPINITVDYYGHFVNVNSQSGGDYSLTTSVNGTGNSVLMNPSSAALVTSQANCHRTIGLLRDYIRSVNPNDSTADFRALANANINSNCNAYFNGSSVNFYTAGGGCASSAYSTIITHEMGHWLNVLYGTGNGSDGMGEGNSDVWAMYQWDTPYLGEDFGGMGSGPGRSGLNTRQFCGDSNPGCYNQVHTDGEVWMGAAWKVRRNLNNTLGNAVGDAVADNLFIGWMNAYNQTGIRSVIETQWLTLDDDNGNIDDGTPNYQDINDGFLEQGFPGFELSLISITGVTELADTQDDLGPYPVNATVSALVAPSITGVNLHYGTGSGFTSVAMVPTGGDGWTGDIPGLGSPLVIDYYLEATDSLGNTKVYPEDAPDGLLSFRVGIISQIYFDNFENGTNGWTHGMIAEQDDWQLGTPNGSSTDPVGAVSGTKAWGNDLGPSGWNGEYKPNVSNWLRSPVIDCSASTGTMLRFHRWLGVQRGIYDQARVVVNGTTVFSNPTSVDLIDTAWSLQDIDISAIADGNPSVQIEFTLVTNSSTNYGGWNLDNFTLYSFVGSDGCINPIPYGTNKDNSLGWVAQMVWAGTASETSGDFQIGLNGAIPGQFALLFSGGASTSVPFYGGLRLVGNPLTREGFVQLDGWGSCSIPIAVQPGWSGTEKYYQYWYRDPAHVDGTSVGLSNALEVRFCD